MVKTIVASGRNSTTVANAEQPGGPGALTVLLLPMAAKMRKKNPGFEDAS
jgi:hypothetical protein